MTDKCKIHKYEKMEVGLKKKVVFKCVECPSVLNVPEMMIGSESICWGDCGGPVKYTRLDFQQGLVFPMCEACREERKRNRELLRNVS